MVGSHIFHCRGGIFLCGCLSLLSAASLVASCPGLPDAALGQQSMEKINKKVLAGRRLSTFVLMVEVLEAAAAVPRRHKGAMITAVIAAGFPHLQTLDSLCKALFPVAED